MNLQIKKKSVLLIEDDEELRMLMVRILRDENFEIMEAPHGHHALNLLEKSECPDLILLDLQMPHMNGTEFIMRLKAHPKCSASKTILVSGTEDLENHMSKVGAHGYIKKPLDLEAFLKELNRH